MESIPGQKPEKELEPATVKFVPVLPLFVEPAIGFFIAWLIFKYGSTAAYKTKISLLAQYDLVCLYLSVLFLRLAHDAMISYAFIWRGRAQISRPSQYVYKIFGALRDAAPPTPEQYVLMVDDGVFGAFNRSMRAVANFEQYLPTQVALTLAAGFVFPVPVVIVTALAALGRVLYMVGYAKRLAARGPGFGMSHLLANSTLYGLVIVTVVKTFWP